MAGYLRLQHKWHWIGVCGNLRSVFFVTASQPHWSGLHMPPVSSMSLTKRYLTHNEYCDLLSSVPAAMFDTTTRHVLSMQVGCPFPRPRGISFQHQPRPFHLPQPPPIYLSIHASTFESRYHWNPGLNLTQHHSQSRSPTGPRRTNNHVPATLQVLLILYQPTAQTQARDPATAATLQCNRAILPLPPQPV